MPTRAFVPAPLSQAEPRVYRSFRGRQLKGLLLAAGGAALGLVVFGARSPAGFGATFLMTLPGFAFGYYQPDGRPVEHWLRVQWQYATRPRSWGMHRCVGRGPFGRIVHLSRVTLRVRRMKRLDVLKEGA